MAKLHSTITSASFFASASFHLSSATLSSLAGFTQNLLSTLDAILGSSESSRAIAAIVTLIRREFRNSETGDTSERVGVGDLLVGSIGFALLQRWGRAATEREVRERGNEEVIWDVVILDNGLRADVVGVQQSEVARDLNEKSDKNSTRPASFLAPGDVGEGESFEAVRRDVAPMNTLGHLVPHVSLPADRQHGLSDDEIRRYITDQLPQGAHASITTETVTSRTITVDVFDHDPVDIAAPPGTAVIEERFHHPDYIGSEDTCTNSLMERLPKHTVVFRTGSNQHQSADISREDSSSMPFSNYDPGEFLRQDKVHKLKQPPSPPPRATPLSSEIDYEDKYPTGQANTDTPRRKLSWGHSTHSSSSSSDISEPETSKNAFGKTSFARITQKVKSNTEEKFGRRLSKNTSPHSDDPECGNPDKENNSACIRRTKSIATKSAPKRPPEKSAQNSSLKQNNADLVSKALPKPPPQRKSLSPKRAVGNTSGPNSNNVSQHHPSRSSFYSVNEKSVESFIAQTDAYSLRPIDRRPDSPSYARSHVRSSSTLSRSKPEKEVPVLGSDEHRLSNIKSRRRGSFKSLAPSMYSMAATGSDTSLVLAPRPMKSVYEDQSTISDLRRDGVVPGLFPDGHFVKNVHRFCRFSSASYGSGFLRVMGISEMPQDRQKADIDNNEHNSFSNHTGLPASTILLSSFVDPAGGSNSEGETERGFPLVHYLSLDHESKAVVLTLRGTWGFEDILTDMTCDYDELQWLGRTWQVHKGMHASARRLLEGGSGRVMATIKAALEEFSDYGVIFCGHSLGGGVASLLATLVAAPKDPEKSGPSFVTASNPSLVIADQATSTTQTGPFYLPAGRPIHVYAYGPPAVMSPSLQRLTRGLITTIVNGHDVVPALSLGVLHDFHAISLAFKTDICGAKSHVRSRVWENITQSIVNKFYISQPPLLVNAGDGVGEDSWAWSTLKSLREDMTAHKLLPPGEVFIVETMRVLQRDAFTMGNDGDGYPQLGRPATRVQLKFIRDVESRFKEMRFGSGMLADHSPARYEASLSVLTHGVLDSR